MSMSATFLKLDGRAAKNMSENGTQAAQTDRLCQSTDR